MDSKPLVKSYCGGVPNYCTPEVTGEVTRDVDAANMTPDRVDETAKSEHEPLYMDMSQVPTGMPDWKPGMVFPAPKKEWVGLTDEEIHEVASKKWWDWEDAFDIEGFSRAIEAKLREKNT